MKEKNKIIIIISAVVAVIVAVVVAILVINSNNNNNNSGNNNSGNTETRDDGSDAQTSAIVGKWKYDGSDFSSVEFIYTFNVDGTGNYYAAGTDMPFTYTTDGNQISIVYDSGPFETEYEINGDILNIKDSGGNDTLYKKVN